MTQKRSSSKIVQNCLALLLRQGQIDSSLRCNMCLTLTVSIFIIVLNNLKVLSTWAAFAEIQSIQAAKQPYDHRFQGVDEVAAEKTKPTGRCSADSFATY